MVNSAVDFMSALSRSMAGMFTDSLIALLDRADVLPGAAELRARTYDLLHPGSPVVDVGCGAGRAVAELNERGVRAIGVDISEQMVAAARTRWPGGDFRLGDAYRLPLGDGEVAGYRADKVFHDLDAPARALAEARRVLAPGGRVVLVGQDWDTIVIDSDFPLVTRNIVHARAVATTNPRAARQYWALLLDAGSSEVTVEVHTAVFTDAAMLPMLTGMAEVARAGGVDTRAWLAEQTERARAGRLFVAVPLFVAAAPTAAVKNATRLHGPDRARRPTPAP